MADYYRSPRNRGCLAAALIGVPILLLVFSAGMMGSGGCEGRQPPCIGDYTRVWAAIAVMAAAYLALAWAINKAIAVIRERSSRR